MGLLSRELAVSVAQIKEPRLKNSLVVARVSGQTSTGAARTSRVVVEGRRVHMGADRGPIEIEVVWIHSLCRRQGGVDF